MFFRWFQLGIIGLKCFSDNFADVADQLTLSNNFLPIDRCGEGDGAGDVEVVGEGATVYLFGQAVVTGGEMEQADMTIDGSGVVGSYGAQDGSEAEVLGEWNLLPVAVSLAFDGVLLSVAYIVVVGIDDPRLHHGVDSRDAFVDDDEAQGVCTGRSLGAVRRLFCICHLLPCRWTTRGECEGGNQEEEKFCLFHITCILLFCVAKLRKKDKIDIIPRQAVKVDAEGEGLNNCSGVK